MLVILGLCETGILASRNGTTTIPLFVNSSMGRDISFHPPTKGAHKATLHLRILIITTAEMTCDMIIVNRIGLHYVAPLRGTEEHILTMGDRVILHFHPRLALVLAIRVFAHKWKVLVVAPFVLLHFILIARLKDAPIHATCLPLACDNRSSCLIAGRKLVAIIQIIIKALEPQIIELGIDVRNNDLRFALFSWVTRIVLLLITAIVIVLSFQSHKLELWIVVTHVAIPHFHIHHINTKHLLTFLLHQFLDLVASLQMLKVSE